VEQDLSHKKTTVRDLFPDLTEEQLKEVEETLHNYAAIAWRVCQRLERESEEEGFDGRHQVS
jgi:hypothetical protein